MMVARIAGTLPRLKTMTAGIRYTHGGTVCMMLRIGLTAASSRFIRDARIPSGNAIDTDISTATETRAMVCMDAVQSPDIRQNPSINADSSAARMLMKK